MWHRVFASGDAAPDLAELQQELYRLGAAAPARARGDDLGWTAVEIDLADGPLRVERYLAKEDDLRDDLNAWAAWLETREGEPNHRRLMERVVQSRQLFTLTAPAGGGPVGLCRWLAARTDGVYQIDGQGFFAADGTPLLAEAAR
jgi:hypothetical protein